MTEENQNLFVPLSDKMRHDIMERLERQQFQLKATEPISWKSRAYLLKNAADHLFDIQYEAISHLLESMEIGAKVDKEPVIYGSKGWTEQSESSLITIYFLLMGYAFENLIKAMCVLKNPNVLANDKLNGIKSHDLRHLCKQCNLKLDENELALLDELSIYVVWRGKYPIPLDLQTLLRDEPVNKKWWLGGVWWERETQHKHDELFTKVLNELQNLITLASNN